MREKGDNNCARGHVWSRQAMNKLDGEFSKMIQVCDHECLTSYSVGTYVPRKSVSLIVDKTFLGKLVGFVM